MSHRRLVFLPVLVTLLLLGGLTTGCRGQAAESHSLEMAPLPDMPHEVQSAPEAVREAYQFAVANPDITQGIPCYCGCGAMGHASNYACYVSGADAAGGLQFDSHALGCSICVDITQDAMRLTQQGKSIGEIKDYVDLTYARYGPSNMP
jgi:hypothetical protein